MRFAHLSDCHLGSWRIPSLRDLNLRSFQTALEKSLEAGVDFILIAGDLFDTAVPSLDVLKAATILLRKVKEAGVRVYVIPGSHDYAPSGKTILDVLEEAGLLVNVMKFTDEKLRFTVDMKTGVSLVGFHGMKGGLEHTSFSELDFSSLASSGDKIFLFHSMLSELKPFHLQQMSSIPLASLPSGFCYYAGGHPHVVVTKEYSSGIIAYPGPIFPNNFQELESLEHGGFYLVELIDGKCAVQHIPLSLVPVDSYTFTADGKTSKQLEEELVDTIHDFSGKLLLVRLVGTLSQGKPSDLNFNRLLTHFKTAHAFLRNTSQLQSITLEPVAPVAMSESQLLARALVASPQSIPLAERLLQALSLEKLEGERVADFEQRILNTIPFLFEVQS